MIADLNDEIAELNDPEKVKNQLCTLSQKLTSKKNKLNKNDFYREYFKTTYYEKKKGVTREGPPFI